MNIPRDPHQALLLLEALRAELGLPDAPQLSVSPGLDFAPGAVRRLEWRGEEQAGTVAPWIDLRHCPNLQDIRALRLVLADGGLLGAVGPLPLPLADLVSRQVRQNNIALADFIDILQHSLLRVRYVGLRALYPEYGPACPPTEQDAVKPFYALAGVLTEGLRHVPVQTAMPGPGADREAEKKSKNGLPFAPAYNPEGLHRMALSETIGGDKANNGNRTRLGAPPPHLPDASSVLLPLSSPSALATGQVPDALFLRCAAIWSQQNRSAAGLENILHTAFGIGVTVEPFRGAWLPLSSAQRSRLGTTMQHRKACVLGDSALLGAHIWDAGAAMTLRLGPLSAAQRRDFLPPPAGRLRGRLMAIVRWYTGDDVDCVVELL